MIEKSCEITTCIDVELFSYINWHKHFHELILKSVCIPLPVEIVKYFLEEIIILPKECYEEDEDVLKFETCLSNLLSEHQFEDKEEKFKVIMFLHSISSV